MKVKDFIYRETKKRALHFSLIDPDKNKINGMEKKVKILDRLGTDAFMIGGSTNIKTKTLDNVVKKIKKNTKKPVILFPGALSGVSRYADAIFFLSLLNSKKARYTTWTQAFGAPIVKKSKIEPIGMGYIIVEPGGVVGRVGKAKLVKHSKIHWAVNFSLAAQYFGMSLVYLEAGSGAEKPVPAKMIRAVKKAISIPLIVGGGIRSAAQARAAVRAGADIIVTGTAIENNFHAMEEIINSIKKK